MEPIRTTEKDFIELNEYNGVFSLIACREDQAGKVWQEWGKKKFGKTGYSEKDLPIKVVLGNRSQAVTTLEMLLNALDKQDDVPF